MSSKERFRTLIQSALAIALATATQACKDNHQELVGADLGTPLPIVTPNIFKKPKPEVVFDPQISPEVTLEPVKASFESQPNLPDIKKGENDLKKTEIDEGTFVHAVVQGETLSKIAERYGVSLKEVIEANLQIRNPDYIQVGQGIVIIRAEQEFMGKGGAEPSQEKKTEESISKIAVRKGDTLSTICFFYGIFDWQTVAERNRLKDQDKLEVDQIIELPIDEDTYNLPYKKVFIPEAGGSISITPWTEDWEEGFDVVADFVAFTPYLPYSFRGHTFGEGKALSGTFADLRNLSIDDNVYFSRTWLGEDGDWVKGEVKEIYKTKSVTEEETILGLANSRNIILATCRPESKNSEAKLLILVEIKNYRVLSPDLF